MTQMIKTLIVDDERYARKELSYLLKKFPSIQVIGEADTGESAVMKTIKLQPDAVFLDIEMPKMNGMEVAQSLLELKKVPLIIFATAYPQFATESFRINAVDYLIKPYDEDQLKQTVHRLEKALSLSSTEEVTQSLGKLAVETDGEISYIFIEDILYMYRQDKVSKIITTKGDYEMKATLKELENRLAPYSFYRIHKSYLINLNYVTRLTPWFNGAYELELAGCDEKLSVSRNYVKGLRKRLER